MRIELKNATIRIKDGGTNSVEMKMESGALTWTINNNWNYNLNKGRLDNVTAGDDAPMSLTLNGIWERLRNPPTSADVTPYDAIRGSGPAAAWVPSEATGDECPTYSVDIVVENRPPLCSNISGTDRGERITFKAFRPDSVDGDLSAGTLTFTGQCNVVEPTIEAFNMTAPIFTSANSATGTVGEELDYEAVVSNPEGVTYTAQMLPPGTTINATTGEVTGLPSKDGTFKAIIFATNIDGTATQTVTFTIAPAT